MVLALCEVAHFHRHNCPVERQPHFAERLHALPERLIRLPKRLCVAGQQVRAGIERQRLDFPDDGQCDDLPEWAFFNVGTLADARKKYADKQAEEKGGAN